MLRQFLWDTASSVSRPPAGPCRQRADLVFRDDMQVGDDFIDIKRLSRAFDYFEASVVAWLQDRAGVPSAVPRQEGAARIIKSRRFRKSRRCQWAWQLDFTSLVRWTKQLRSLLGATDESRRGWARGLDRSWLAIPFIFRQSVCLGSHSKHRNNKYTQTIIK